MHECQNRASDGVNGQHTRLCSHQSYFCRLSSSRAPFSAFRLTDIPVSLAYVSLKCSGASGNYSACSR